MKRPVNLGGKKSAPTNPRAQKPAPGKPQTGKSQAGKSQARKPQVGKASAEKTTTKKPQEQTSQTGGKTSTRKSKFVKPAEKLTKIKEAKTKAAQTKATSGKTSKTKTGKGKEDASQTPQQKHEHNLKVGKGIEIPEDAGKSQPIRELLQYRVGASERRRGVPLTLVLAGILIAVFLFGKPTYTALVQYDQYRNLQQQLETARKDNENLRRELAMWSNPDFIENQARERLGYAKPGEYQYLVLDPGPEYKDRLQSLTAEKVEGNPWFVTLMQSASRADQAARADQVKTKKVENDKKKPASKTGH